MYRPATHSFHNCFIESVPPSVQGFMELLRCACQGKVIQTPLVTRCEQIVFFHDGDIVPTRFLHAPNDVLSLRPPVDVAMACDRILTRNRLANLVPGFFEGLESLREL